MGIEASKQWTLNSGSDIINNMCSQLPLLSTMRENLVAMPSSEFSIAEVRPKVDTLVAVAGNAIGSARHLNLAKALSQSFHTRCEHICHVHGTITHDSAKQRKKKGYRPCIEGECVHEGDGECV